MSETEYAVADADEIPDGGHLIVQLAGRQIGVFNIDGEYYAHTNWCPHQSGPICEGELDGTTDVTFDRETLEYDLQWVKENEILRCPWHAWEFDAVSGECIHGDDISLISHPVSVEDGEVIVSL